MEPALTARICAAFRGNYAPVEFALANTDIYVDPNTSELVYAGAPPIDIVEGELIVLNRYYSMSSLLYVELMIEVPSTECWIGPRTVADFDGLVVKKSKLVSHVDLRAASRLRCVTLFDVCVDDVDIRSPSIVDIELEDCENIKRVLVLSSMRNVLLYFVSPNLRIEGCDALAPGGSVRINKPIAYIPRCEASHLKDDIQENGCTVKAYEQTRKRMARGRASAWFMLAWRVHTRSEGKQLAHADLVKYAAAFI